MEDYGSPEDSDIPKYATDLDESLFQIVRLSKQDSAQIYNNLEKQTPLIQLAIKIPEFLGHLPFTIMQRLARVGWIPKYITSLKGLPPCAACLLELLHKKHW